MGNEYRVFEHLNDDAKVQVGGYLILERQRVKYSQFVL